MNNPLAYVLLHVVFTVNMIGLLVFVVWSIAARAFPRDPGLRRRFHVFSLSIVVFKALYVLAFANLAPERILSTDGGRYLSEMQKISDAPWQWNPVLGIGVYHDKSAKMGMSYIYGILFYLHGVRSLYAAIAINIVFAYLTCAAVFLLTRLLTEPVFPAFMAMFATAVYPETLYWNGRIVRENLTLFLVPVLVFSFIRMCDTRRIAYVAATLGTTFLLAITRVQLAFLLPLMVGYFVVTAMWRRDRAKTVALAVLFAGLVYSGRDFFRGQAKRAHFSEILDYFTLNPGFWARRIDTFLDNAPAVLTIYARQSHGELGILIAPVVIAVMTLFVFSVLHMRRIFPGRLFAAGLCMFVVVVFIFILAASGLINMRFRASIIPLVLALVSASGYYYWRRWGLPRIRLLPRGPAPENFRFPPREDDDFNYCSADAAVGTGTDRT